VAGEALQEGFTVAWHRRETWWVLVWVTVLAFLLGVVGLALGFSMMQPGASPFAPGGPPPGVAGHAAGVAVFGLFLILVGIPFVLGGIYGTIADAIREQSLGPATFWENGIRYFGRAWGVVIMAVVVGVGYMVVLAVPLFILRLLGGLGMFLFALVAIAAGLSWAVWIMWASGALFVGHQSWGASLRSGWDDMRRHFGPAVMVMLAQFAIVVALALVDLILLRALGVLGRLVGAALEAWVTLFVAAAELSLYRVAHGVPKGPAPPVLTGP
jgi:hypothetical protein